VPDPVVLVDDERLIGPGGVAVVAAGILAPQISRLDL